MKYFKLNQIVIPCIIVNILFALPNIVIASTERIICCTLDGWKLDFKDDGSASFIYGSLPNDQALVAAGTFDIQLIEKEILTLDLDRNRNGKKLAVHFSKSGEISSVCFYVDDLVPCQKLIRKVLLKSSFWNIERFRETVAEYPPFEMYDIVISEEHVRNSPPAIVSKEKVEVGLQNDESKAAKFVSSSGFPTDLSADKSYPLNISSGSQKEISILTIKPYYIVLFFGIIIFSMLYVIIKKRN